VLEKRKLDNIRREESKKSGIVGEFGPPDMT
jgi:hypothetical protein